MSYNTDTTEGLTRFLRDKNTSIDDIYTTCIGLLGGDEKLSIPYRETRLPKKEKFILELLCDRLSQGNLPEWKTSSQVWEIFAKTWQRFDEDKELTQSRDSVLRKTRLNETVVKTVELQSPNVDSWFELSIKLALKASKLNFTQDQSIAVIGSLATSAVEPDVIVSIFNLCNTGALRYSKKNVTKFCGNCIPLLAKQRELMETAYKSMIQTVLISPANRKECKNNLGVFINNAKAKQFPFVEGYNEVIKLCIPELSVEEIEEVFTDITKRYPESASTLLEDLSDFNKVLSTDFLAGVVKATLKHPDDDSLHVLTMAMEKNSEVGIRFGRSIFERAIEPAKRDDVLMNSNEVAWHHMLQGRLTTLEALYQCFENLREVPKFIQLWQQFLRPLPSTHRPNPLALSNGLLSFMGRKLVSLPYPQLERIVQTLIDQFKYDAEPCNYPLTAIARGLLIGVTGSSNTTTNHALINAIQKLKPLFLVPLTCENPTLDIWRLRMHIMMLYDLDELKNDVDFEGYFDMLKTKQPPHFYGVLWRILEQDSSFHRSDKTMSNSIRDILTYVASDREHVEKRNTVLITLMRWSVLMNKTLASKDIKLLVGILFDEQFDTIEDDLNIQKAVLSSPLIHEQDRVIPELIDWLTNSSKWEELHPEYPSLIPTACYKKSQRSQMLDTIYEHFPRVACFDLVKENSLRSILHMLDLPTMNSKIEKDPECLMKIAGFGCGTLSMLSENLIDVLVKAHENSEGKSSAYIKQLLKLLAQQVPKVKGHEGIHDSGPINIAIKIAACHKKNHSDEPLPKAYKKLLKQVIQKFVNILPQFKDLSITDKCWVCNSVARVTATDVDIMNETILKDIVKQTGNWTQNPKMKEATFNVVTCMGNAYDPEYVMALFLALGGLKPHVESLDAWICRLSQEEYLQGWKRAVCGLQDSGEYTYAFVSLVAAFVDRVKKPEEGDDESSLMIRKLLSSTLSVVLESNNYLFQGSILDLLNALRKLVSEQSWAFSQHSIELLFTLVIKQANVLAHKNALISSRSYRCYVLLTQIVSNVLLFQRHRISNRLHLLSESLIALMEPLFAGDKMVSQSAESARAYERLMGNVCEPSISSVSKHSSSSAGADSNEVTSASTTTMLTRVKKDLRRTLPVVLLNYLRLFLSHKVNVAVREHITNSIYMIFKILTLNELNYINASVDSQCRAVLKKTYEDYTRFGKWRED